MQIIPRDRFDEFLGIVKSSGYQIIGPKVKEHAICYEDIEKADDLPLGITDVQKPGFYRLKEAAGSTLFDYVVGADTCKKVFYPAKQPQYTVDLKAPELEIKSLPAVVNKVAILGVRACELAGIQVQDKVLMNHHQEYTCRRENSLLIAVNCTKSEANCFCTSMKTGPKATQGFDIALTEVYSESEHYFVAESGTEVGASILAQMSLVDASNAQTQQADTLIAKNAKTMQKTINTDGIQQTIYNQLGSPIWEEIESRCLSCGNCTQACPTCFCSNTKHETKIEDNTVEVSTRWDSCFSEDFSYTAGGVVRGSTKSRYRQWMSHKLATWIDQFGSSGCVGCGRCVTWCPVGIDITEELKRLQRAEKES